MWSLTSNRISVGNLWRDKDSVSICPYIPRRGRQIPGNSQPDVDLGDLLAKPERTLGGGKVLLGPVKGLEECNDVPVVCFLSGGEARLVNAVVDLVVGPLGAQ